MFAPESLVSPPGRNYSTSNVGMRTLKLMNLLWEEIRNHSQAREQSNVNLVSTQFVLFSG